MATRTKTQRYKTNTYTKLMAQLDDTLQSATRASSRSCEYSANQRINTEYLNRTDALIGRSGKIFPHRDSLVAVRVSGVFEAKHILRHDEKYAAARFLVPDPEESRWYKSHAGALSTTVRM